MQQLTTLQEVHDHITKYLIDQGKPALGNRGQCRYRGYVGTSCAVGCLISDDNYDEALEGSSIMSSERGYAVQEAVKSSLNWEGDATELIGLLSTWQDVHDNYFTSKNSGHEDRSWCVYIREEAVRIAKRYGLDT